MEYRIGKSLRIKEQGQTVELTCPKCSKKVKFSVFSNRNPELIPDIPFLTNENVYFLICPECASVFGINKDAGKVFTKGEELAIGNFDLKELKSFK